MDVNLWRAKFSISQQSTFLIKEKWHHSRTKKKSVQLTTKKKKTKPWSCISKNEFHFCLLFSFDWGARKFKELILIFSWPRIFFQVVSTVYTKQKVIIAQSEGCFLKISIIAAQTNGKPSKYQRAYQLRLNFFLLIFINKGKTESRSILNLKNVRTFK